MFNLSYGHKNVYVIMTMDYDVPKEIMQMQVSKRR